MFQGDVVRHKKTGRLYMYDFDTTRGRAAVQRLNRSKVNVQIFDPNLLEVVPTVQPERHEWTFYEKVIDKPDNGRVQKMTNPLGSAQAWAYLKYAPLTGSLTYKAPVGRLCWVGLRAGAVGTNGHRVVTLNGCRAYDHRICWMMYTGEWPTGLVYHIDTNRSNNAISNLRMLP